MNKSKLRLLNGCIGEGPIVPDNNDWKLSHYLLFQWTQNKKERDKNRIRKMQMDCLLDGMALNRNWYVVTHDKDFKDLKATEKGRNLRVFYP